MSVLTLLENGATIKLIGDSITAGEGSSDDNRSGEPIISTAGETFKRQLGTKCWSSQFSRYIADKYPNSIVLNFGLCGLSSSQIRECFSQLYCPNDDIVIFLLGSNDRKLRNGMKILFDNLTYMVKQIKKDNNISILMSPNPSTAQNESYSNRLYHQHDVKNVIEKVANDEGVLFIDHFSYIQEYALHAGKTIEDLLTENNCISDGLHPTDIVHFLMYKNLIQNLNLGFNVNGVW